ncbi:hypothetical protein JHK82_040704 [Glycine max]|uniref:Uncharacterized protein n=2 Tax=Glycine subgen. Soja TaxID=1462606 RepID=I1MBT7_SOYBN|nr:hypothetical protein JHK86_040904 [Glycine max]KHN39479.1 hypothetical protein glysoja_016866 [Glycine soja]KAG4966536.1 hypothetical protein JHK85_041511 [Glycine max]KAG5111481.1 hypothetical protein JHK82_040704 [Glycine max]KAG5122775.1 hypothetical protein JHK84_041115 [Glycine max]
MNIIRMGLLVCSSLPLLSCFMELFVAATASQPHFNTASSEENKMHKKKDVSITANVAAQKHFRQIQQIC